MPEGTVTMSNKNLVSLIGSGTVEEYANLCKKESEAYHKEMQEFKKQMMIDFIPCVEMLKDAAEEVGQDSSKFDEIINDLKKEAGVE